MIPTIQTARLKLREPRFEDWPAYAIMMTSERAAYMGGPMSIEKAWGFFCHDVAQWHLMGHGALMIDRLDAGQCIGQVSINYGPLFPEKELGWFLYAGAEGMGYAFEAAKALQTWAGETRSIKGLVSYVDPANLRSRRLAERLGAKLDPLAKRADPTDLVFRHP